jgi:hypothetical protein
MEKEFNYNELQKVLNLFREAKANESIESYIYIKNLLQRMGFPIPFVIYPKGSKFVRCRIHNSTTSFFNNVKDISYHTDVENIKSFGRANEPGQSVFYCSDDDWISYVETSPIARNGQDAEKEIVTTGLWIATTDILVASVLNNEKIRGKNKKIDSISQDFEKITKMQGDENAKIVEEFFQFLSSEFAQESNGNSNQYKITAAFTNYIFNSVKQADGILFPSSLYIEKGLNFALKTNVVDKKMKFHSAIRRIMEKKRKTSYVETELLESKPSDGKSIEW